jgi:carboxymethylenebutenolidase
MHGTMVRFPINGRDGSGYMALPPTGSGPGVLVIQEYWGLVEHIKHVADRFAAQGFVAFAPDMYHGEKAASPDAAGKMLMALNIAEAGRELRAAARSLLARPEVTSKTVAAVGFCMGGQLALFAACAHPDLVGAAVDFYGIHPNVHPDVTKLSGPVLAHFGKNDLSIPAAQVNAMVQKAQAAGKTFRVHWYDAGHAFFNDTRPQVFSKANADLAWTRTLQFLRGHFRPAPQGSVPR